MRRILSCAPAAILRCAADSWPQPCNAVLNPNDTVRVPRFHPRTPPGRPLEVGWAQEFARWLWHLFVLPHEQAQPWPRWMHRFIKPLLLALARQLNVYNPYSLRAWLLGLT